VFNEEEGEEAGVRANRIIVNPHQQLALSSGLGDEAIERRGR
jgi:hypothetical protein